MIYCDYLNLEYLVEYKETVVETSLQSVYKYL